MRLPLILPLAVLLFATPAPESGTVAAYTCRTTGTNETQTVKMDIKLTVPATAPVGRQMTIGWRGSYVEGAELRAPATGLDGEVNLYAYAAVSGIDRLTSVTGVGSPGLIVPGAVIPLPRETVELRTTPRDPGTGTVRPASVNFGPTPQRRLIECELQDKDAPASYPLTVTAAGTAPSPDAPSTPDTSDTPNTSDTSDTSDTSASEATTPDETSEDRPTATPTGGANTGGGGEAGPDGRALVLAGSLVLAAALTGLRLRRPSRP
ncbi:hypothetical protein ABT158_08010 [Nonomuraea sp. NPDC001636]|uniref:hypothetical protein n=1 Tax=Nonomuraea sp. NPDC001636 TaxID=3154391 RepID=UPI00332AD014